MNIDNAILIILVLIAGIMLLVIWLEEVYRKMKEYEKRVERLTSNRVREEAEKAGEVSRMLKESNEPVPCKTCKCLINKQESYKVLSKLRHYNYLCNINNEYYYCQKCKPAYTRIESKQEMTDHYAVNKYFKELEVTEQGEPVGYKKDK